MVLRCFLVFCFVASSFFALSKVYVVDLKIAEKMALKREMSRSIYEKEREISSYAVTEKYLSLFPSLTSSLSVSRDMEGLSKPKLSFGLKQEVPNPFKWSAEKKALQFDVLVSHEKIEKKDLEILEALRKKFFKVNNLKKKLANAEKNMKMLLSMEQNSQSRFASGSLASYDLRRVLIKKRQTESSLRELRKELKICLNALKLSLNIEANEKLEIKGELSLDLTGFDEDKLLALIKESKNIDLSLQEYDYQKKEFESFAESFYYMPSLSLEANYSLKSKFSVQANLTWKMFSGASGYYKYQKSLAEKEKSYFKLLDHKDRLDLKARSLVLELSDLKEDFDSEMKTLEDAKAIFLSSKERFSSGIISSQDMSSDFSAYTLQENRFLDLRFKILEILSEFSSLVSNRDFLALYLKTS